MDTDAVGLFCMLLALAVVGAGLWSLWHYVPRFGAFVVAIFGPMLWLVAAGLLPGLAKLIFIVGSVYCGLAWFAAYHYRRVRRDELLMTLATAAETQLPLEQALGHCLRDCDANGWRAFFGVVCRILLPTQWFAGGRFDDQLRRAISLLEMGLPPAAALACVPGVATPETSLALYVGESTGKLAPALEYAKRTQQEIAPAVLDQTPRLLYLLFLVKNWVFLTSFMIIFIVPKYEKIFADFHVRLPQSTELLITLTRAVGRHGFLIVMFFLTLLFLIGGLFASTTMRWHVPIVRRVYRPWIQSRFLAMLGMLLASGKNAPRSLELLGGTPIFAGLPARRIAAALRQILEGRPLIDSLEGQQLLPRPAVPLARTAERTATLPWALQEIGDHCSRRTLQRLQRWGFVVFPLLIGAIGLLVMWHAVAYFAPMVQLLENLGS